VAPGEAGAGSARHSRPNVLLPDQQQQQQGRRLRFAAHGSTGRQRHPAVSAPSEDGTVLSGAADGCRSFASEPGPWSSRWTTWGGSAVTQGC